MTNIQYSLVKTATDQFITVFIPGRDPLPAGQDHPNFDQILSAVVGVDDPDGDAIATLFDVTQSIADRFDPVSRRVSVGNGRVYFDGDEIHSSLTEQILRFMEEGVDDWQPLVNFFEKVQANPTEHSREQLYEWLSRHRFTITPAGNLVGYKGVKKDADGNLVSVHSGPAIVDGVSVNGHVPNAVGSVIEVARSYVNHNPAQGCSTGLHVGTYDYAKGYASGALLEVHVDPADVVSVPTDCNAQKVRVCRYTVVGIIDAEYAQPLLDSDRGDYYDDEDEDWYDEYDDEDGDFELDD